MNKRYDWLFFLMLAAALAFAYRQPAQESESLKYLRRDLSSCFEQLGWNEERVLFDEYRVSLLGPHRLGTARIVQKLARRYHRQFEIQVSPARLEDRWAREAQDRCQEQLDQVLGADCALFVLEPQEPRTESARASGRPTPKTCWLLTAPDFNNGKDLDHINEILGKLMLDSLDVPPEQLNTLSLRAFNMRSTPDMIP